MPGWDSASLTDPQRSQKRGNVGRQKSDEVAVPRVFGLAGRVLNKAAGVALRLPGADRVQEQLGLAERLLLSELRQRMEQLDDGSRMLPAPGAVADNLPGRMETLLTQSAEQSVEEAERALFGYIIGQLLPDEARVLAALSDGSRHALVNIGTGPRLGPMNRIEFHNLSAIGKPALVKLRDQVPLYIEHLRSLRLLSIGDEAADLEMQYQILESDKAVLAWQRELPQSWGKAIRIQRRSLHISAFGLKFWNNCQAASADPNTPTPAP